jgi:hypothetical protein
VSNASAVQLNPLTAKIRSGIAKRLLQIFGGIACWTTLLFSGAGRLDWLRGWISAAYFGQQG